MTKRSCGCAALAIVLVCVVASQGRESIEGPEKDEQEWKAPARAARKKNPVPANEKSIARGEAVYSRHCQTCHGDKGKGNGPKASEIGKNPANLADPKIQDQTDGALFWKITEGRKPMPSFEKLLNEEERWEVLNYIRSLAPKKKQSPKKKESA